MITIGVYFVYDQNKLCDSCDNVAMYKILAKKDDDQIGIRLCDNCLKELRGKFKNVA